MIVEDSDDDCETMPIQRSKTEAKSTGSSQEPVHRLGEGRKSRRMRRIRSNWRTGNRLRRKQCRSSRRTRRSPTRREENEDEEEGEREKNEGYGEEEPDLEEEKVEELLPCFPCKSDVKIATIDDQ